MNNIKTYSEFSRLETFKEKYDYLKLSGTVGESTFGHSRFINQGLYTSRKWRQARDQVIVRDMGCDLGEPGFEIHDKVIVHHMNPITPKDIELERDHIFDPEYLVSTSQPTHNAIHYGDENQLQEAHVERRPGDTCPWR
jgi:hypothetical protein